MEVKVKKLYDVSKIVVPDEMKEWKTTDSQIQEQLEVLSRLSAKEENVSLVEKGDCVVLSCTEGALKDRTVLLYPGLNLPGAEKAEEAVIGLAAGSELVTELHGAVKLKIEKIVRRVPTAIDDALVQMQNIEGVTTVDAYRAWYKETTDEANKERVLKGINAYYIDMLAEQSEFEYDQTEIEQWIEEQIQMQKACGEEIPEEMFEMMRAEGPRPLFREAVAKAICEAEGFTFTPDMFEDELKMLVEQMPEMEAMLDEYKEMYVQGAYMDKAMELLSEPAKKCLEVE